MCFPSMYSNLQNFLTSMTPIVPSKSIPQSEMKKKIWNDEENEYYFTLGDIWEALDEWSAYGVGTPVFLSKGRNVVQYYAPYLSAIQIYISNSSTTTILRNDEKGESGNEIEEFEMEYNWNSDGSDSISVDCEVSLPMKHHKLGFLYFEYQDVSSPYWRIPITDKIENFRESYPGLVTLKSYDISPASWMSIAWYPIYEVPTKWYVKDLSTSFLTYHTLSSLFQDSRKCENQVCLPPFGLATHRMQGDVWILNGKNDHKRIIDLYGAADSWLKQLNFDHHDFNFFNMHSNYEI